VDGRLRGSDPQPVTFGLLGVYAANRINSNLKGNTKQFGWLQAPATQNSFRLNNFYRPCNHPN
jgi:hypothetical protein